MYKTRNFVNMFSAIFCLCGIFFLINKMFMLGIIALASFGLIKFIDSDWAFDNFNFKNHNKVVVFVTTILIFVNFWGIYHEFRFSSIFQGATKADKETYMNFEDSLFKAMEPCINGHNGIIVKIKNNEGYSLTDADNVTNLCYKVINDINTIDIPKFSDELNGECTYTKEGLKKIAVDVAAYKYESYEDQSALIKRVETNMGVVEKHTAKIREMMKIKEEIPAERKNFIKF